MPRTPIIGGNWKMNLDLAGATALASDLRNRLGSQRGAQVVVFPPFPFLHPVLARLRDSAVEVGAQDVHTRAKGAYTSGVSAGMIRSLGCTRVLVGHSERRAVFGDSDAVVAEKLKVSLEAELSPILCIGETLDERNHGRTFDVLARQLDSALAPHRASALGRLVVAYEPVWAIGTGVTATPGQAQEVHAWVRGFVASHVGADFAASLRLQYGGSVTPESAPALLAAADIDGALVGGASLDCGAFAQIVRAGARR